MNQIKEKETDILYAICDYLTMKKHYFWRNNTIPVFSKKGNGFIRMPKYSRTGLPDIILIRDGFTIGIEVKTQKGRPSPNQIQCAKDWKENGAEYYLVRSIDEVIAVGL